MTEMIGINSSADGEWDGTESKMVQFHGKDETYGKPPEGSLTEARAKKASQHINHEVTILISVIRGIGKRSPDNPDHATVKFGKLFQYYTKISNKVVGILLRARRWHLVRFEGEMLFQGQNDDTPITVIVGEDVVPTIHQYHEPSPSPDRQETLKDKLSKINRC